MSYKQYNSIEELETMINDDLMNGLYPTFLIHTIPDPLESSGSYKEEYELSSGTLADIAEKHAIWLHMNLSQHGCLAILDEFKYLTDVKADSMDINTGNALDILSTYWVWRCSSQKAFNFLSLGGDYFKTSYESTLLWVKDKNKIQEGMNLSISKSIELL